MSSIDQVWESDWRLFTEVSQDTILLLVNGTAHTRMKAIGRKIGSRKITVKTSATSDVGRLTKSLKKHFVLHFNPDILCTFHFVCPCNRCVALSISCNFHDDIL